MTKPNTYEFPKGDPDVDAEPAYKVVPVEAWPQEQPGHPDQPTEAFEPVGSSAEKQLPAGAQPGSEIITSEHEPPYVGLGERWWPEKNPEALLQHGAALYREQITNPATAKVAEKVRGLASSEPRFGWWGTAAPGVGQADVARFGDLRKEATDAARRKPANERTAYDNVVLGVSTNPPADLYKPKNTIFTYYGYYDKTAERLRESLDKGKVPEEFKDPKVLEQTVNFLVHRGLAGFGNRTDRASLELQNAAKILETAAWTVPGFDPENAGLEDLYRSAIQYTGVMRAEAHNHSAIRTGRSGDAVAETVAIAREAAETASAARDLMEEWSPRKPRA